MTEREQMVMTTVLDVLAASPVPMAEPTLHMMAQTRLGARITVAEIDQALHTLQTEHAATGLPGALGRIRWSITDAGRHLRANLNP